MTRTLVTVALGAVLFATGVQAAPAVFRESRDLTARTKPYLAYSSESAEIKGEIFYRMPISSGNNISAYIAEAKMFYVQSHCQDNDDYPRTVTVTYAGETMLQCHAESTNDDDDVHDVNMTMFYVNSNYRYVDISVGGDGTAATLYLVR